MHVNVSARFDCNVRWMNILQINIWISTNSLLLILWTSLALLFGVFIKDKIYPMPSQ